MALLLTFTVGANAQDAEYKKSWDFTKGLSDETIANLTADATNWAENGKDGDGNVNNWKNNAKHTASEPWTANGVEIAELKDLLIDIGSNGSNSIHLATTKLRLTRKNTKITFPKLKNGQKITIVGRSANGTAVNRGIAPVQNYIKFQADESSPQTGGACIFVGGQVEGSEGTYTFVWKVETESAEAQDIQFTLTPDAGIDFTLFMIDEGDTPPVESAKKVAYIGSESDLIFQMLNGNDKVTPYAIDPASNPTLESLSAATFEGDEQIGYDAVAIGSSVSAEYAAAMKGLVAYIPVVNFNTKLYKEWGYGDEAATATGMLTVKKEGHDIFEGMTIAEGQMEFMQGNITGVTLGDYFAKDDTLAVAGDNTVAIHVHNAKRNAYYLLPIGAEDVAADVVYTDFIPQVLVAAAATKKDVQAVGTPVISFTQADGVSTVSISAANSKKIYYTLDGTDPTAESTLYTEPFELTAETTVKAWATGDGYTPSAIAEKVVTIATQAAAPAIAIAQEAGKTTVTITSDVEGAKIYFNCDGAATAALSQAYTDPIELTEPATIYAFVEAEGKLASEKVQQEVAVQGFDRFKELAHFDSNQTDWFVDNSADGGSGEAKAYYYWGNKAASWEAVKTINPNTANGWVLKSQGQVMTGELTAAAAVGVGNGATGYYAEEAVDYITSPTKGKMTFGAKMSANAETGETYEYTARIETTDKLQAPLDVVVIAANGNDPDNKPGLEIQVSEDGETWTKVGDVKMADTQRYIKRTRVSYDEAKQVYVRVAHTNGGTKGQVHDIYVYGVGEATGISELPVEKQAVAPATGIIYNIAGQQVTKAYKGLVIINGRKYMNK